MRVAVDLTPGVQGHAGIGRYAEELGRALLASCPPGEALEVFFNSPQPVRAAPPMDRLPVRALHLSNKAWRLRVLLAHALHRSQDQTIGRPDVFLATDHLLPYTQYPVTLFILYDVTFLSHARVHTPMNRTYMRMMMPTFLRAADAVICISQSTLSDARARYPMIGSKGHVIYPGVSARFRPPQDRARLDASPAARALRARLGLPERFLLYVGTIEPRKNLAILFEALKQADLPDTKLVIAGKMGWLFRETVARVHDLGLEETVIFAGFVPDDDLPMLYSLAEAFVFPSLYEGFGLPVVEAMACGTPVLCTNVSSLPEVAGDAALMSAPGDVGAWAKALRRITEDPELRADLSRRGPRQAARFTWRDTAEQTRAVYQDLWVGHNIRRQERGLTPCA